VSTTGSTTERSDTTGIGGTAIRTAIRKSPGEKRATKLAGRQRAASSRVIYMVPASSSRRIITSGVAHHSSSSSFPTHNLLVVRNLAPMWGW